MKTDSRSRNWEARLRVSTLVGPGLLWTLIFFIGPLLIMVLYSLWGFQRGQVVRELTLENYTAFAEREYFLKGLTNSLEVAALVTLISLLVAYPQAYILAYIVPSRWQRLALLGAVLPFWTSYVVRSYSWLLILTRNGVIGKMMETVGLEPVSFANNRTGTVIGFVHFFAMLLTLTIYANLVQIPANYRKASADLGASAWGTFWRVTFPLSVPGVVVGTFLTFVLCMGDYITPQILGGGQELLLPQAIMLQVSQRYANFPMASALSLILMMVITVAFIISSPKLRLERV